MTPRRVLAAVSRAQHLVIAVFCSLEIVEIRRFRLAARARSAWRVILDHLEQAAIDFDASMLIVEPDCPCEAAANESGLDVTRLAMADVFDACLPKDAPRTYARLFDRLVADRPRLIRLVRLRPGTLHVSMVDRRKTVSLLAVALGLAALRSA